MQVLIQAVVKLGPKFVDQNVWGLESLNLQYPSYLQFAGERERFILEKTKPPIVIIGKDTIILKFPSN